MTEPVLSFITSQDINTVTISKSALAGLTPQATNTGESLLVAMLLTAAGTTETPGPLHPNNWAANPDQSVQVDTDNLPSITSRTVNGASRIEKLDTISLTLSKSQGTNVIDPDDY
jgi:hypothetical protein